ncbi:GNAT family N-acetyltransferase [Dyadobacter sp. CY343]|uniref:GNAT family N-acetyltransferase n=1 Tax=Dyadobacter sp. CY343 TaxID=2907299 RepID=UPI001F258B72|nr:GNAT family N-acetyltransferase [Dyadobacter sp. CY343]
MIITDLKNEHIRKDFQCGNELLNRYLAQQARQDVSRGLSACFVLAGENLIVKGYYTLSSCSDKLESFPEELAKRLPKSYNSIPTTLLGRLACDISVKGQRYGEILLIDALKRSLETTTSIGSLAVVVDPIDEQARSFYQKYEFIELVNGTRMFLPMKTIKRLFAE